jgi:hypothetical protein
MSPLCPAADTVTPISPGGRGTVGAAAEAGAVGMGVGAAGRTTSGAGAAGTLTAEEVPRADPAATTAMIAACTANDAAMIARCPRRRSWRGAPFPAIPHPYPALTVLMTASRYGVMLAARRAVRPSE